MSELQSNRRRAAQEDLELTSTKEQAQIDRSIEKELQRQEKKLNRQIEIEESSSYRAIHTIATWMDKYYIDPLLGFVPGIGDTLSQVLVLPYIYVSLFKVRSIPLTLAVIFNSLLDMAIGLIPFWIGNICDFFNRSYLRNCRLISGFVEDDKEIIQEVNRKAGWMFILILLFCLIIYWLISLAVKITEWIGSLFS